MPIAQFIMNLIYKHASIWLAQFSHNYHHDTLFPILLNNLKKMHNSKLLEFAIDDTHASKQDRVCICFKLVQHSLRQVIKVSAANVPKDLDQPGYLLR